jgi:hypothetical protein
MATRFTCRFCSKDYTGPKNSASCGSKDCERTRRNKRRQWVRHQRASTVKQRGFSFDGAGNIVDRFGEIHPRSSFEDRFWSKTERRIGECWLWTGNIGNRGYGFFHLGHEKWQAHRMAYGLTYGSLPDGPLDHLCRNPKCINPTHLEAVTHGENMHRGIAIAMVKAKAATRTHCRKGHPLTPDNVGMGPRGRFCRTCRKICNAKTTAAITAARRARKKANG